MAPDDRSSVPAGPLAGAGSEQVRVLLDAAPSGVVGVDADGLVCYVNDRFARMFGYRPGEALGIPVEELLPDAVREENLPDGTTDAGPGGGGRRDGGSWAVAGTGRRSRWTSSSPRCPPRTAAPAGWSRGWSTSPSSRPPRSGSPTLSRDYLTLAEINQAIVRAPDPATLFTEACRIAVEQGGYLGAWVGERGPGRSVRAVVTAGVLDDYIAGLGLTLDPDDPRGQGPTARAMRESRAQYTEQFMTDPATTPWLALAAGRGIGASATVPLRCGDRTVAVITLYSPRAGRSTHGCATSSSSWG